MTLPEAVCGTNSSLDLLDDDLGFFCRLIEEKAGILLKPAKRELVRTRLRPRVNALGLETYSQYRELLQRLVPNDPEWRVFINLLTTNKTDFFREPQHFSYLTESILPEWLKSGASVFNVWSAASSTGEEAYTLAMVLDRYLPKDRDFRILGTDIDTSVIAAANNAVYQIAKKDEIPSDYHRICLDFGKREACGWFRIKPRLKNKVTFLSHNLIEPNLPRQGEFDLVLCRNVMIYFGFDAIDHVQKKLYSATRLGGHLFIGHAESFQGISHEWKSVGPSVFRKGIENR